MDLVQVGFLGILQGLTEWLPISSSGHLVLFENWLNIQGSLSFDVFLHLASLLVILFFFRRQIIDVIKEIFHPGGKYNNWWWYIIISNILTAIIGFYLYQRIDIFRTNESVSNWLIVSTLVLLATKFSASGKELNYKHAIVLGLVQGLAVLPGLSRSGAVIATALIMKVKKEQAFEYGFLVAIPAIAGSFLLTRGDFAWQPVYLFGFIITMIVSYLALILLRLLIKRDYFYLFFIYTLALSLIIKIF